MLARWTAMVLGACLLGSNLAGAAEQGTGRKLALLVGVSEYEYDRLKDLVGPANDVVLWRSLLVDVYGFDDADVITLSAASPAEFQPIRAHIEAQIKALAEKAQPGDWIVITLGGHGSQQPDLDNDDQLDPEPDGLDEIFLPADAGVNRTDRLLPNAILDDELREWLGAITAKGALLWLIADCCHSGTITRSPGDEVERKVDPSELFTAEELADAEKRATKTRGAEPESGVADGQLALGQMVAIYAAQTTEPTIELALPKGSPTAKVYGLLTYTACEILTEAAQNGTKLTYAELVQNVYARYAAMGRSSPTPLVEGGLKDNFVLGGEAGTRPDIVLVEDDGEWKIKVGSLHGMTTGSKLLVYPPAGSADADEPLGYVEITSVDVLECSVRPCAFEGMAAPAALPAAGRCDLVFVQYENNPLKLAIAGDVPADWAALLEEQLAPSAASRNAPPVVFVDDPAEADWVVWFEEDDSQASRRATLVPAAGVTVQADQARSQGGQAANDDAMQDLLKLTFPADDSLAEHIETMAKRIKRVQSLLTLSTEPTFGLEVELKLYRLADLDEYRQFLKGDTEGLQELVWDREGMVLEVGDIVGFEITNPNDDAIDVTLLYLDSGYGITPFFPDSQTVTDNRLQYNQTVRKAFQIESGSLGMEHLLLIALRAERDGPPVNFIGLQQDTMASANRNVGNPLETLLLEAAYTGTRMGSLLDLTDNHKMLSQSFRVVPAADGEETPQQ